MTRCKPEQHRLSEEIIIRGVRCEVCGEEFLETKPDSFTAQIAILTAELAQAREEWDDLRANHGKACTMIENFGAVVAAEVERRVAAERVVEAVRDVLGHCAEFHATGERRLFDALAEYDAVTKEPGK